MHTKVLPAPQPGRGHRALQQLGLRQRTSVVIRLVGMTACHHGHNDLLEALCVDETFKPAAHLAQSCQAGRALLQDEPLVGQKALGRHGNAFCSTSVHVQAHESSPMCAEQQLVGVCSIVHAYVVVGRQEDLRLALQLLNQLHRQQPDQAQALGRRGAGLRPLPCLHADVHLGDEALRQEAGVRVLCLGASELQRDKQHWTWLVVSAMRAQTAAVAIQGW